MITMLQRTTILMAVLIAFGTIAATDAQAQYTPSSDFELAWSLDPRNDTANFPRGPAFGARSVLAGMDLDGDGNKEILFTTDETLAPGGPDPGFLDVYLYETNGDNSFEYVWHYTHDEGSNSLPALAYGDIDDDGKWEIYFGIPTINDDPNDLYIFEQDDTGVFPATPTAEYDYERDGTADFRPAGFQVVDVDKDGQKELITVSRTSNARELVVISPDAGIDAFATFTIEFEAGNDILAGGGVYDVDVVDFDQDGLNEIWVNTWNNWSMSIFESTAADTYQLEADLDAFDDRNDPGSFNSHDMHFVDTNNDGKPEGLFPMTNGIIYYLPNTDDVSTLDGSSFASVGRYDVGSRSRGADVGDIDGDGLLDIIANNGTGEQVWRIEWDGVGAASDSTSWEWSVILDSSADTLSDRYYPLRIADDLDDDGKNEVVLTNLFASQAGQPIIMVLEYVGGNTAIEKGPAVIDGYALYPSYPNPFADRSTVRVELDQTAAIAVEVFDITGRRVKTLIDRALPSGTHDIVFESDGLPAGVYLIRLSTPSGTVSRTATLVR